MLLEAYYEQNKDRLVAVLSRYSRDMEGAADAVQDAFLKALKNRALLSTLPEKSLWAWLYTSAKNALIDEKRKTSRNDLHNDYSEINEIYEICEIYESDSADDLTDVMLVRELLHKLPPNLIHIVSLRYYGDLNSSEIGALKGIPAATVRTQLRTALKLLKSYAVESDFFL